MSEITDLLSSENTRVVFQSVGKFEKCDTNSEAIRYIAHMPNMRGYTICKCGITSDGKTCLTEEGDPKDIRYIVVSEGRLSRCAKVVSTSEIKFSGKYTIHIFELQNTHIVYVNGDPVMTHGYTLDYETSGPPQMIKELTYKKRLKMQFQAPAGGGMPSHVSVKQAAGKFVDCDINVIYNSRTEHAQ